MDFLRVIAKYKRNKTVRVLIAPFAEGIRRHQLHEYWKTENSCQLKTLKNIRRGQWCFIIGNDPRLKSSNLDSNRIFYIYEYMVWHRRYLADLILWPAYRGWWVA